MKKATNGMAAVVVGFALLALSAVPAPAAERPGIETYVVRNGDTLAKIAGRVFGDVKRWREILRENPQVTNANLIFPGDVLRVPVPETATPARGTGGGLAARAGADAGLPAAGSGSVRGVTAAAPAATGGETMTAAAATGGKSAGGSASSSGSVGAAGPGAATRAGVGVATAAAAETSAALSGLPVEKMRPSAVINPALYRSAGYIAKQLPTMAIIASPEDRIILGTDDTAIVNAAPAPGTRFTVVRAARRIFHPVTRESLGWLVRVLGSAEVTCLGERTATVALRMMNDAAGVGDYLVPIDPNDVLEKNALAGKVRPGCVPAGAFDGVNVAFNEDRRAAGEQELAYIDRGTESGVTPGQRFTIYREVAPEGRVSVGELQVLRVGAKTATALITTSYREIQVGNLLRTP